MATKELPEIPVMVEGIQKWVTGLTPKTTCDDVIHSLLINLDCPVPHEAVFDYALFENWRGIERPLKGRSKFVKLWKDWGGERSNVQLTLRKIDSTVKNDIYGSMKKKQKSKNWFKLKDKSRPVAKSTYDLDSVCDSNAHEDSSIMMQNKENLFCAFNCYSKKKSSSSKGLKERDSNMRTPFEKPRSIQLQESRPKSIAFPNLGYTDTTLRPKSVALPNPELTDSITCIYSKEQYITSKDIGQYSSSASIRKSASIYGSTASLRKDNVYSSAANLKRESVYGSTATLRKEKNGIYGSTATIRKDMGSVYGSTATLRKDNGSIYGSTATMRKDNVYGSTVSLRKDGIYGSASSLRKDSNYKSTSRYQSVEPIYSTAREPYIAPENYYEYPNPRNMGRQLPQNPVDWDYDYDKPNSGSDSEESDCEPPQPNPTGNNRLSELLNIVLSQERFLQDQIHRIKRADKQIEQYEYKLHNIRSKEQGKDYLQDTYLKDAQAGTDQEVNLYESLIQDVASMDDKLAETYSKLDGLSTLIHNESQQIMNDTDTTGVGPFESTRIDPAIQKQIDELRDQLQATINMSLVRENEITQLDNCLVNYEKQLKNKEQKLDELAHELSTENKPSIKGSCSQENNKLNFVNKKPAQEYSEMGIDVGSNLGLRSTNNVPCDNEVEKILHSRQVTPRCNRGQLTPVGTTPLGVSVNAIVEYNNETVDLDDLYNIGRRQNPAKLFNEVHGFKPINDVTTRHNVTDDIKQKGVSISTAVTSSASSVLPPVGAETIAKVFSSKLMPDLTITSCTNSHAVTMETTAINESICAISQGNDTSLWNTQDDGIDVTFSLPPDPKEKPENTYFNSPNKTNALLESTANIDCESPVVVAARPPRPAHQIAAQKSRVKKKLFNENNGGFKNISSKNHEQVEKEIKDIMCSLTGDISGSSRLSESGESGVGSMGDDSHNDVSGESALSWGSSFVETAV